MYFRYFEIIFPWKKAELFIWKNLNPLHSRRICTKFGCNWLSGSGEEDFFNFVNVFSLFHYYLPLKKLEFSSPNDALCQIWLKLAQWFWRRRFLNFVNDFCYFVIISPWKRAGPSSAQTWIPFTQGCLLPNLVEIGPVDLQEKIF